MIPMPTVSVIIPVDNAQRFLADAIQSVLGQSFPDFELIIVNDGVTDARLRERERFRDWRIRIIHHGAHLGRAAARNTGINHARGDFIAFLDADDVWKNDKLMRHIQHFAVDPEIGLSFSRSSFMNVQGEPIHGYQMPKLFDIDAAHLLCRNPVGNGSAPVLRRETLQDVRFLGERGGESVYCYFDEDFRQSEDIECWLRIAATTSWQIEGIPEPLTVCRINEGGVSGKLHRQFASWEKMMEKAVQFAPELVQRHGRRARAHQLRYLARQAIRFNDGLAAARFLNRAVAADPSILREETAPTLCTAIAAYSQCCLPRPLYAFCERIGLNLIGKLQRHRIARDGVHPSLL
tara:strand:+ start:19945 stop:20991 length:1047 start_codon:yes stop_codon:yes gene_type:complete